MFVRFQRQGDGLALGFLHGRWRAAVDLAADKAIAASAQLADRLDAAAGRTGQALVAAARGLKASRWVESTIALLSEM